MCVDEVRYAWLPMVIKYGCVAIVEDPNELAGHCLTLLYKLFVVVRPVFCRYILYTSNIYFCPSSNGNIYNLK